MLWTDIYLNRICAKVYEIRVFKVYLEIEHWRLGKANLLGMTACGSDWKKTNVLCLLEIRESSFNMTRGGGMKILKLEA